MKVHSFAHKLILLPIYYIFHHNLLFGYLHKIFFKTFRYKKYKFNLKIEKLPTSHRASFLFKTYEYNDRIICEKNLSGEWIINLDCVPSSKSWFYSYSLLLE